MWGAGCVRRVFSGVKDRLSGMLARRARLRTAGELREFLAGEAAHVAQSATYDYLRARAGRLAPQLFREQPFLDALEVTRWEAYAAVLADLVVIAETSLRPHAADDTVRTAALASLYREALAFYPPPAHRADGWQGHEADLARRLTMAREQSDTTPDAIAGRSGEHIFAHLPLHPDIRRLDEEMVVNNVRFRILRSWETMQARVDFAAVAADLAAPAPVDAA